MTLADVALGPKSEQRLCKVALVLKGLDEQSQAQLVGWLKNPDLSYARISDAVNRDPDTPNMGRDILNQHARGVCACGGEDLRPLS